MKRALLFVVVVLSGCGMLQSWDEVNNPSDDDKLSKCRTEGRMARQMGDAPEEAYAKYVACTSDAGLR